MKYWLLVLLIPFVLAYPCTNVDPSFFNDVQIVVGSKADISDAILASKLAYYIALNEISVRKVNISVSPSLVLLVDDHELVIDQNTYLVDYGINITSLKCEPSFYIGYLISEPNVSNMVVLDYEKLTARNRIIIGGWYVNSRAYFTKKYLRRKGDILCEVRGNYMYIAGYTADDTIRASTRLLNKLKYGARHGNSI